MCEGGGVWGCEVCEGGRMCVKSEVCEGGRDVCERLGCVRVEGCV